MYCQRDVLIPVFIYYLPLWIEFWKASILYRSSRQVKLAKRLKFRPIFHRTDNKCLQKTTQQRVFKGREKMIETKHFIYLLEWIKHWRAVDLCRFLSSFIRLTRKTGVNWTKPVTSQINTKSTKCLLSKAVLSTNTISSHGNITGVWRKYVEFFIL